MNSKYLKHNKKQPTQIILIDKLPETEKKFFLFDGISKVMSAVNKNTFRQKDLPTMREFGVLVKYSNVTKSQMYKILVQVHKSLNVSEKAIECDAESIIQDLKDMTQGISVIVNILSTVGQVSTKCNQLVSKLKESKDQLLNIFLCILNVMHDLSTTVQWSISKILMSVVNCLGAIYNCKSLIEKFKARREEAQSVEAIVFTVAMQFLPTAVKNAFKNLTLYTNTKVCDDINLFNKFLGDFFSFVKSLAKDILPEDVYNVVSSYFSFGEHYLLLAEARKLINTSNNKKEAYLSSNFRKEVYDLDDRIRLNTSLVDWSRTSSSVKSILDQINMISKICKQYENASRVEPVAFCFEGMPGVKKSVLMTQLIQCLNLSVYTHCIKAVNDGKDFYDCYNNEDIFAMDDVGQGGPSQFRPFFNFIAPVKMPLDCARAELKDSKFFNSKAILFTTNSFMNLNGVVRADMIADIRALWRRVQVFEVTQDTITVKHYNVAREQWMVGFQVDIDSYFDSKGFNVPVVMNRAEDPSKILAWLKFIVTESMNCKQALYDLNVRSVDMNSVDAYMNTFKGNAESIGEFFTFIKDYLVVIKDKIVSSLSLLVSTIGENPEIAGVSAYLCALLSIVYFSMSSITKISDEDFANGSLLIRKLEPHKSPSTAASFVQKQVKYCKLLFDDGYEMDCIVALSGHYAITVCHALEGRSKGYLTIYKTVIRDDLRLVDKIPFEVTYVDKQLDICILQMAPETLSPFKSLKNFFNMKGTARGLSFLHPEAIIPLDGRIRKLDRPAAYAVYYDYEHTLQENQFIIYEGIRQPGLCGSLIFDESRGIMGMHVMGVKEKNSGGAVLFDSLATQNILSILNGDGNICKYDIVDKDIESGVKLNKDYHCSNPKSNSIVKSPLYGIFDNFKEPVDPVVNGPHTVKDSFNNALCKTETISPTVINEIEHYLDYEFGGTYEVLTDYEIIKGTELLAGVAKDTSTGVMLQKEREHYIDFEKGEFTVAGKQLINDLEAKCKDLAVTEDDLIAKEAVKIETRTFSKNKMPRTFRVMPMHVNLLLKKYLGRFVERVVKTKWQHGIMLSFNPYYEFNAIDAKLDGKLLIASDVAKWDKKMNPQVQFLVAKWIISRVGKDLSFDERRVLATLVYSLCNTPVAVNDDTYLTTHSLPSGCYITTLFNSMVQWVYLSIWHYNTITGTLGSEFRKSSFDMYTAFKSHVTTFIMGDDLLLGIDPGMKYVLDAFSLKKQYTSFGLDLTDSSKKEIVKPFDAYQDVTFLQRKFSLNAKLGRVVGVLSPSTLFSSLSWVDSEKDIESVMCDKINVFQRECFLYADGDEIVAKLFNELDKRFGDKYAHLLLDKEYLLNLYLNKGFKYETFDGVFLQ